MYRKNVKWSTCKRKVEGTGSLKYANNEIIFLRIDYKSGRKCNSFCSQLIYFVAQSTYVKKILLMVSIFLLWQ